MTKAMMSFILMFCHHILFLKAFALPLNTPGREGRGGQMRVMLIHRGGAIKQGVQAKRPEQTGKQRDRIGSGNKGEGIGMVGAAGDS